MSTWQDMDRLLRATFMTVGGAALVLVAGGAVLGGAAAAASITAGALVALSNLFVLSRIVAIVVVPTAEGPSHARMVWSVIALAKTMVLFGGVWLLVTRHMVDPIQLVVGYGCLPIGIAIGAVVSEKTGSQSP
jgi:hypothetical protein